MRPEEHDPSPDLDLFRHRLEHMLDQRHELFRLSALVDWHEFNAAFGPLYCADNGSPANATRLMVGLQYLKHMYGLSDGAVVKRWVENPYWQCFCGEDYFQHQLPIDPSCMTSFRQRIGEAGCEQILKLTVKAGLQSKTIKPSDLKRVTVDTTVQEKAVSFPTDSKLLNRSLKRRQAIEPVIGHLKADGLLGRNYLKGSAGGQMNVMLSCAGHNLRLILRQLRIFCRRLFGHAKQSSGPECFVGACKALLVTGFSWGYPWAPSSRSLVHQLHAN